jgi:hypothetical protein
MQPMCPVKRKVADLENALKIFGNGVEGTFNLVVNKTSLLTSTFQQSKWFPPSIATMSVRQCGTARRAAPSFFIFPVNPLHLSLPFIHH